MKAWTEGQYSWSSPQVIATLVIGVLTVAGFFLYGEHYAHNASHPRC